MTGRDAGSNTEPIPRYRRKHTTPEENEQRDRCICTYTLSLKSLNFNFIASTQPRTEKKMFPVNFETQNCVSSTITFCRLSNSNFTCVCVNRTCLPVLHTREKKKPKCPRTIREHSDAAQTFRGCFSINLLPALCVVVVLFVFVSLRASRYHLIFKPLSIKMRFELNMRAAYSSGSRSDNAKVI